jgi:hypothetical protein
MWTRLINQPGEDSRQWMQTRQIPPFWVGRPVVPEFSGAIVHGTDALFLYRYSTLLYSCQASSVGITGIT